MEGRGSSSSLRRSSWGISESQALGKRKKGGAERLTISPSKTTFSPRMRNTPRSVWAYDRDGGWNSRSIVCVKTRLADGRGRGDVSSSALYPFSKREREWRTDRTGHRNGGLRSVSGRLGGAPTPFLRAQGVRERGGKHAVNKPQMRVGRELELTVYEFDEGARGGELQVGERVHLSSARSCVGSIPERSQPTLWARGECRKEALAERCRWRIR